MLKNITIHSDWLHIRVADIGAANIKCIIPIDVNGEIQYQITYIEPQQSSAAAMFL